MSRQTLGRIALILMFVTSIVVLGIWGKIPRCSEVKSYAVSMGPAFVGWFFLAYVLSTIAFVPGTVLTMMAGMIFGVVGGSLLVSIAATLGAFLAFLLGRFLLRQPVESYLRRQAWFPAMEHQVAKNGFNFILLARLLPLIPFNALNYASGVLPLSARHYLLGSYVGMLPGTIAYVYAGEAGCQIIDPLLDGHWSLDAFPDEAVRGLAIATALLAISAALPLILKRKKMFSN